LRLFEVFNLLVTHFQVAQGLLQVQLQLADVPLCLLAGLRSDLRNVADIEHVLDQFGLGQGPGDGGTGLVLVHIKYDYIRKEYTIAGEQEIPSNHPIWYSAL
jgi:hypothetical protein